MGKLGKRYGTDRIVLAVTPPLEEFVEHAERGEGAGEAPAPHALAPTRGEEGADVARRKRQEPVHIWQAIELPGKERQELPDVALIGLRGLGRELALGGKISEPRLDRLADKSAPHMTRCFCLLCQGSELHDLPTARDAKGT